MSTQDNGGPAFPSSNTPETGFYAEGMTLRDYFAIRIDVSELAVSWGEAFVSPFPAYADEKVKQVWWADVEAAFRYQRADAMLRARGAA